MICLAHIGLAQRRRIRNRRTRPPTATEPTEHRDPYPCSFLCLLLSSSSGAIATTTVEAMAASDGRKSDALSGRFSINGMAGGGAACTVLGIFFPIDTLKTTMQTSGLGARAAHQVLKDRGGMRAFYRGFSVAVTEHTVNRGILFAGSTYCKQQTPTTWPEPVRDAVGGIGAGLGKTALLHPLDTVKTRWQLGEPAWPSGLPAGTFATGLYRGITPAAMRSGSGMAIWLSARNFFEQALPAHIPIRHFVAGFLASTINDLVTFPLERLPCDKNKSIWLYGFREPDMAVGSPVRSPAPLERLLL